MNAFQYWIELLEANTRKQLSTEALSLLAEIKLSNYAMATKLSSEIHNGIHGAVFGINRAEVIEFFEVMKEHDITCCTKLVKHLINKFTS